MKINNNIILSIFFVSLAVFSCKDNEIPEPENEEEIITDITLTFTPQAGGDVITAAAQDSDGEGPEELEVTANIALAPNTHYILTLNLENSIENESITDEIMQEDDEHMFFFGWTSGLFSDPTGDGNIGENNRGNPVNYTDEDDNGNPVGLETTWTTGASGTGTFRVMLKHQPDIKTATSTSIDGETDLDITWGITVN